MWTTDVWQALHNPLLELEVVSNSETPVPNLTPHLVQPQDPLCFFNSVCPIDVLWNFSAAAGSVPPFLTDTVVDQPAVQEMILSRGVYREWYRNRMTKGYVMNVYNINRDDDPWNVPTPRTPFDLFPTN